MLISSPTCPLGQKRSPLLEEEKVRVPIPLIEASRLNSFSNGNLVKVGDATNAGGTSENRMPFQAEANISSDTAASEASEASFRPDLPSAAVHVVMESYGGLLYRVEMMVTT
jgi:hypothetical protein